MKLLKFYTSYFLLIFSFAQNLSFGQQNKKAPVAADANWYSSVINNIEKSGLDFYAQKKTGNYRAANMNNRYGFLISPSSFSVHNIRYAQNDTSWEESFSLISINKGPEKFSPNNNYHATEHAGYLNYEFDGFGIEYINNAAGLRQNFIISQKPAGHSKLNVHLTLKGNLIAKLSASSKLAFHTLGSVNNIKIVYDGLKVWDANHKMLSSSMSLDASGKNLTIEVDDKNASYPLTIDPITHSPEWATSADGLLSSLISGTSVNSALYGYTVTGLGDVNGDGFGDVAVSAPALADIFSGSGTLASVGAVFVFYGSVNGLSTTPNKTLQPNTAVAGALFGMSVDAGDVTGDGINDIVVGAPLDQISITSGIFHISGSVGKVYVYPGGNLAAANPSNFLTLQLNNTYVGITNIALNPLFGFSVAVTEDLNGDNKKDILVGAPVYASILSPLIKTGAAFLFLSGSGSSFTTIQNLQAPSFSVLGINIPLLSSINGLLFGYSVDGIGDYNGDGVNDIIVGAPAGVNLSSLSGILNGQILGGQAFVYYGTSNHQGVSTSAGATLEASSNGVLGNAANLFGFKVKGARTIDGARNGNVFVGAPLGGLLTNALSLTVQSGNVSFFKKKNTSPAAVVSPDQVIETPRSTSILQVLNTMQLNVLFGAAIDNLYDINCDGYPDLVIGEPLSTGTNLSQLQASAVGGSAYVYYGNPSGGFQSAPSYTVSATYGSDILSVNATALFGFSVAGALNIKGSGSAPRVFVGSPSGALDFNGLLNIGGTISTLFNFAAGNNGPGKAYGFDLGVCSLIHPSVSITLPVTLISFTGHFVNDATNNNTVQLNWSTSNEMNMNSYEVEKSTNGTDFHTLAIVFAADSQMTNEYKYTDKKNAEGFVFYRLKMVDGDGKFTYSGIINFHFISDAKGNVLVYPNPVRSTIRVVFTGMNNGEYHIRLYNVSGQLQQENMVTIAQHQQTESFSRAASMIPGIYWMNIFDKNGNKVQTVKIFAE